MPLQHSTSLLVRGLRIPQVRLPPLRGFFGGPVRRRVRRQAVSLQLAVKVDLDRADVGRADGDVAEKAPAPAAEEDDPFVEGEEAGEGALQVGGDAEELSRKVAAALDDPVGGGVEAVVVAGGEVDDGVVERAPVGGLGEQGVPGLLGEREIGADFRHGDGRGGDGLVLGGVEEGVLLFLLVAREEVWEGIGDAVYAGEFFVFLDQGLVVLEFGHFVGCGCCLVIDGALAGNAGGWCGLSEEGVDCVGHSLDLLDIAAFYAPELEESSVRGGEEGVGVGIQWASAGLEGAVEEGGEVGEVVEVGFFYLVQALGGKESASDVPDVIYATKASLLDSKNERI